MTKVTALFALALPGILGCPEPLSANTINFAFQATVNDMSALNGWGNIHTSDPMLATFSWDTAMPVSAISEGRGDFYDQAYPISMTLTIGAYTFASTPTFAWDSVTLFQDGSSSEIDVSTFVTADAWPSGLTAGPASDRLGWLQVAIYGGPSMLSSYSALPASIDTSDVQQVYGWINPDFQSYTNAISYSASSDAFGTAPEPTTLSVCAIGAALMLFSRWIPGKRRD